MNEDMLEVQQAVNRLKSAGHSIGSSAYDSKGEFFVMIDEIKVLAADVIHVANGRLKLNDIRARSTFNYNNGFRIHGKTFGDWKASAPDDPVTGNSDQVAFKIVFTKGAEQRTLRLRISDVGIHHDADRAYEARIFDAIKAWLDSQQDDGELECYE